MKHLDLTECNLRTLPPEMWRLKQLEWLEVSSNPLQTLPAEIGQLTNIEHLDLSYCELRTLTSEVWRLTQLEWLDLSYNPLQTLPAEIGQLINVKHLDLSCCKLHTLPHEVGRLTQLEWLDLSSNPLQTLSVEIGQLTHIKHLDLAGCQLRTLLPEVGRLTQLEWLKLSDNTLMALPVEIAQLTNISHLDVSGNSLRKPPAEVCRQGILAIRQYFDELERSKEDVSACLKVIVLGETMAGKTSLVQTLSSRESSLTKKEDRTHCVEITQWAPDDNITFEVYDFGGHDVYHLTHQFFLTPDALILLTVNLETYNCTQQSYNDAVGFWLDTLNARVPGAVVTVVGSKSDRLNSDEIEEKTRNMQERITQHQLTWQRSIQQQIKKLEDIMGGTEAQDTDQEEIKLQLERTKSLLTRPLRLTGVYCVSSAEPTHGLDTLMSHIIDTANNTELFPSLRRTLPRTWVDFELHLRDLRGKGTEEYQSVESTSHVLVLGVLRPVLGVESKKSKWLTREECLHQGQLAESKKSKWLTREECLHQGQLAGLTADRLEPALSYLQQVGTILRYTDISELKDLVFHDPSGLIDVMKELFHHDLNNVFTNKNPRLNGLGFSNTQLKKIRKNLSSRGFLPREVVIALLGPHATPVGNVDVITKLMEHFGLCYTDRFDEQDGETSTPAGYYIPWYIQEERPKSVRRGVRKPQKKGFTVTCEMAGFCPRGLFERLSVVVNKLITSRQDWKDVITAVTENLPVIVYRETKDDQVNIIVKLTVPAQAVQGTQQLIWDNVISPLKDKLSTLLKEWPGLLYRLAYSTFTQPAKQKGDSQTLSVASIIPTFEVGPRGCTVQHGGVTLEFPEGCVRDTRFISVEVEAVPVTEDVRNNLTAMSAVLTVKQDFPQRFLRPVTVRLPWVWSQSGQKKEDTAETVVLHYSREDGWTVFPSDVQEGPETVVFQTDRFQRYVVTTVRDVCTEIVELWGYIWNGYCEDKVYLIVMPNRVFLADPFVNLLCVHKTDDVSDVFSIGYVSQNHQIKQRISMTNKERIRAYMQTNYDLQIDPRDFRPDGMIFDFPPADRNRYTFAVEKRTEVSEKDFYQGRINFERLDLKGNVKDDAARKINWLPLMLHRESQGVTPGTFVPEDEHLHVHEVSQHRNTDLRESSPSQQHHQARPQPTVTPTARYLPTRRILLAMTVVVIAMLVYPFYSTGYINSLFRLPGGGKDGPQNGSSKLQLDRWLPHTVVAGLFAAIFGIWFFVFPKGKPVVMLVNDEFGTSKGGISTINGQLRDLLTSAGAKVIITALKATEDEKQEALNLGIDLILPNTPKGDKRTPTLDWLTYDHKSRYPNLPSNVNVIVGHADVTSKAARNIRKDRLPKSKFILFNHVMPEDTEHHKSGDKVMTIEEKMNAIRKDTEEADVVFSVGPTMYDYYKNQIRLSKPHHLFLPKPSDIFSQMNVTYVETETKVVLCVGRVKGVEKLKGYDLVAKAMDKVLGRFPMARLRVRGVSTEDFPESKEIIQANMKKGTFHFTPLKYGTQQQLSRDFKEVHLVLMPSRAEPFGLVGLEAIAAGVPTIVSDQSGLAKFLKAQDDVIFDRPIVKVEGNDEEDATRLADRIVEILENGRKEFKAAKELKQKLLASKYWNDSHRKFLEECGIPQ
ncbi:uncharacterized protein LOC144925004 [Branchiostoma floridae x Branchiostoma belcheri]